VGPIAGLNKLLDEIKCLTPAMNQTPDRSARSTVTMLNELSFSTLMAKETNQPTKDLRADVTRSV